MEKGSLAILSFVILSGVIGGLIAISTYAQPLSSGTYIINATTIDYNGASIVDTNVYTAGILSSDNNRFLIDLNMNDNSIKFGNENSLELYFNDTNEEAYFTIGTREPYIDAPTYSQQIVNFSIDFNRQKRTTTGFNNWVSAYGEQPHEYDNIVAMGGGYLDDGNNGISVDNVFGLGSFNKLKATNNRYIRNLRNLYSYNEFGIDANNIHVLDAYGSFTTPITGYPMNDKNIEIQNVFGLEIGQPQLFDDSFNYYNQEIIKDSSYGLYIWDYKDTATIDSYSIYTEGGDHYFGDNATFDGNILPSTDNTYQLGDATHRFTEVWATNGTIQTSSKTKKKDIIELDQTYLDEFYLLNPVTFKWDNDTYESELITLNNELDILESKYNFFIEEYKNYDKETKKILSKELNTYKQAIKNKEKEISNVNSIIIKNNSRTHTGLIAEDVNEIYPNVVYGEGTEIGINYAEIIPILINTIQDQKKDIDLMQSELCKGNPNKYEFCE